MKRIVIDGREAHPSCLYDVIIYPDGGPTDFLLITTEAPCRDYEEYLKDRLKRDSVHFLAANDRNFYDNGTAKLVQLTEKDEHGIITYQFKKLDSVTTV